MKKFEDNSENESDSTIAEKLLEKLYVYKFLTQNEFKMWSKNGKIKDCKLVARGQTGLVLSNNFESALEDFGKQHGISRRCDTGQYQYILFACMEDSKVSRGWK